MDDPVTDIAFVAKRENCPKGYKLIDECPCGHEAQLWEKVFGGKEAERYLCYTKEDKNGTVITDMYIPKWSAQYLHKGYKIVDKTVEGRTPMRHKQLAVKRVPRDEASTVVADVIVCRNKDDPSQMYKKLEQVQYKPKPKHTRLDDWDKALTDERRDSDPPPQPPRKEHHLRAATMAVVAAQELSSKMKEVTVSKDEDSDSSYYTPTLSPVVSPLPDGTLVPTTETIPPSYYGDEVATVKVSNVLESAPPPPPPNTQGDTSLPPPSGDPVAPPRGPSLQPQAYPQPNTYRTPSPYSGYPPYQPAPTTSYYPPQQPAAYPPQQPAAYPPQQPAAYPPPPQGGGYGPTGYDPRIGFALGSRGAPGYPPAQPPAGGYASIAGSSFLGAAPLAQPPGTAPYNPYLQGSAPYRPTQPTTGYPPPASQPPGQNYGFNF